MDNLYQTISKPNGEIIKGAMPTLEWFDKIKQYVDFKDKTVLDLGCAEGMFSVLARQEGAKMATGIDSDKNRIKVAQDLSAEWGYDNKFHTATIQDFEYPHGYDIVIASLILHWLPNIHNELDRIETITGQNFITINRTPNPHYKIPENGMWFPTNEELDATLGFKSKHRERLLVQDNGKEVWLNIYENL